MIKTNGDSSRRLDFSKQSLKKLPAEIEHAESISDCNVDDNEFSRLEGFDQFKHLRKLSARHNRLVKISGLSKLCELVELDLSGNALQSVENLKSLRLLEKLNLSDNNIKVFSLLGSNQKLRHLDLSSNGINSLCDISSLHDLQTLDLSKNIISSISSANKCLPTSLVSLDLSENEIGDLCEISCLHFLAELEYLGFSRNRCVSDLSCDYRPFVVNWCYKLKILDGRPITQHERLKAEWLFSQGHGRRFALGSHDQLIDYLSKVCLLTDAPDRARKNQPAELTSPVVREAWASADTELAAVKASGKPRNVNDMQVEDVTVVRDSSESCSKIQSESVFLPVAQAPENNQAQEMEDIKIIQNLQKRLSSDDSVRPLTAPSGGRMPPLLSSTGESIESDADEKHIIASRADVRNNIESPVRHLDRPKTSPASASSINKYEEYESRPCRPMSKQLMKELFNEETTRQIQPPAPVARPAKQLINGRPSPSAQNVVVPEKASVSIQENDNVVKRVAENPAVQPSRLRARRGRIGESSSNAPASRKSSETAASIQSKAEGALRTPEIPPRVSNFKMVTAAVKVQSVWRGYCTRKRLQPELRALAFRRFGNQIAYLLEMRKADAEHIRQLEETLAERDRQDRKARRLQTAAIKQLWEQVQSMKQQLSAVLGNEASKAPMPLQPSLVSQSNLPSSVAADENSSVILGGPSNNNGPLSSLVSDSVRSVPDASFSPPNVEQSPTRRDSHNLDFGITRRSPYAVRQTKVVSNGSPSTPGKSQSVNEDLGRAAALSPLATPPRTRQVIGNTSAANKTSVNSNSNGGDGRRMALAAKFSYLPDSYRSFNNTGSSSGNNANDQSSGELVASDINSQESVGEPAVISSSGTLYERVRHKLGTYQ